MNFEQEKKGDVIFITLPGETFEAAMVESFNRTIAPVIEENAFVVFDLSNIRFLDSMGCGALVACQKKINKRGCKMGLCCARKQMKAVFQLIGFSQLFDVFDTRKEALTGYS